ncbi:MAG: MOSC domain-containing protein [Rhodospirillales bacterium]|nr:MOSC domain-containing protein [Rhodospirillales bacterium]
MSVIVQSLYRYPVKGLNADSIPFADLRRGYGIPFDRTFAIALATTPYDPSHPQWLSKQYFATLTRHERLAAVDAHFDEEAGTLSLFRKGKQVARGNVGTPIGRAMIEEFLRAYLRNEIAGPPHLVGSAAGPMMSDSPEPLLSLVNLATIADIERVIGRPVHPLRFRANVYVAGAPAWAEFAWLGETIALGDAQIKVTARIPRCAATNVEPGTGLRDMTIPQHLERVFGHTDCGILAAVSRTGRVAVGDVVHVPPLTDQT